ncbi:PRC-barrel domain containing protein [Haloarchaeobius sp. HRN-SO-5]|uniref:PRC-barrel domain containing protein n=1 Tax=Haloarchaeobius sp. HRN-SO-5 TaxID=3446118 RepID=UPI003EBC327D
MADPVFTDDDRGKRVVNADGDKIGMISNVQGDVAHVDPDPGITDQIRSKLGWDTAGQEEFRLDQSKVNTITEDEVRLKRNF